jgi:hypothetical protein
VINIYEKSRVIKISEMQTQKIDEGFGKRAIEGYASATSVHPGETISFHVHTNSRDQFTVAIYREPDTSCSLHKSDKQNAEPYPIPNNAHKTGCRWPAGYTFKVPDDWRSGIYKARLSRVSGEGTTDVSFVVKAIAPGKISKILLHRPIATFQAYNTAGGGSFYSEPPTPVELSLDRPYDIDIDFLLSRWELPFVQWLENNNFQVEYCTSIDLHSDSNLLKNYQLLLSVGHDEYWSWEMRDNVEAFIANGGNVAFFSGNVSWWQIRFEDNNRTIVCYKDETQAELDANPGIDPSRLTKHWKDVGRRENQMTGVSYENGAGWYDTHWIDDRPAVGYRVRLSQHWVFDNTNLKDNDEFGAGVKQENLIVGYETDAALFTEINGIPVVTGTDETPLNFQILATADLRDWNERTNHSGPDNHGGPDGKGTGKATLGIYRNNGIVFTAATTDWARGLIEDKVVQQITYNVITRLTSPDILFPYVLNSGFEEWSGSKPDHWVIESDGTPEGRISREDQSVINGKYSLKVDATTDRTWVSQGEFDRDKLTNYRVSCWAKTDQPGATIRLQSTDPAWADFAIAEHSGSGNWEYLSAVGTSNDEGEKFRVKIQVAQGVIAFFDNVTVEVQ